MTFRRFATALVLAFSLVLAMRSVAYAHATLLKSTPAAGSRLDASPSRIWLKFSEEMEPGMATVTLTASDGKIISLKASGDPHDVSAIVASIDVPLAGEYLVTWHVVSADGHPVGGRYTFTVTAAAPAVGPAVAPPIVVPSPPRPTSTDVAGWGPSLFDAPILPAALRGLAMASLAAFAGLLFFYSRDAEAHPFRQLGAGRVTLLLGYASVLFIVLHACAWMVNAIPDHHVTSAMVATVVRTSTGGMELWRIALTVLAVLALGFGRPGVAAVFAFLALAVSGKSGHAAALYPAFTTPAKALHLIAGAVWLGGLAWLVVSDRTDPVAFRAAAARVSSASLIAVIIVALSGVIQTKYFIGEWGALLTSSYGAIALAKAAGLLVLLGFGAYHRYRVMPSLPGSADVTRGFTRTLRAEIALMVAVICLGALLAYMPPPPAVAPSPSPLPSAP